MEECAFCLEDPTQPVTLPCSHTFCKECTKAYKRYGINDVCPLCRADLPPGAEQLCMQYIFLSPRLDRYIRNADDERASAVKASMVAHARQAATGDLSEPNNYIVRQIYGESLRDHEGDLEGAEREWREAVRLKPNNAFLHDNLGSTLKQRGDSENAESEHRKALRCDSDYVNAHVNLGVILKERGGLESAECGFREALRYDPDDTNAHFNLGTLLHEAAGDLHEVEHEYREAMRYGPSVLAGGNLGVLLMGRGDLKGAEREFRRAPSLDKNDAIANYNLGNLLKDR